MNLLRSLAEAIGKMFAADPWLTIIALASVGACAAGLHARFLDVADAPFLLAAGIVIALAVGVARGARR